MKRLTLLSLFLAVACGPDAGAPVPGFVPRGTGAAVTGVQPDGGFVDPCTQVDGHDWFNVVDTVVAETADPVLCPTPPYNPVGTVTVDVLPVHGNRFGPCPIAYAYGQRMVADGGLEPTCRTTATCSLHFNGGDAVQSFDFTWNIHGGFGGVQDQTSTGQLCPYVKLSTYRDGGEP